jgi:hypothetical protein
VLSEFQLGAKRISGVAKRSLQASLYMFDNLINDLDLNSTKSEDFAEQSAASIGLKVVAKCLQRNLKTSPSSRARPDAKLVLVLSEVFRLRFQTLQNFMNMSAKVLLVMEYQSDSLDVHNFWHWNTSSLQDFQQYLL